MPARTLRPKKNIFIWFAVLFLFIASSAFAQQYQVTAIEPPAGYTASRAMGINNLGEVVGRFYNIDAAGNAVNRRAFVWDIVNGAHLLPTLAGESSGWAVNDNGFAIGYSYNTAGKQRAVLWDLEGWTIDDIGGLRNPNTGVYGQSSTAYGINNLDQVVGSADIPNDANSFTPFHAFLDDSTGLYDLGTLTSSHPEWANGYSIAYGINNNGDIVGIAHDSDWNFRPFIENETSGMQALQIDTAYASGEWYAVVINDAGLIGGHVIAAENRSLPYYWPNKTSAPVKITMPQGFPYGEIYGINASGQMVGIMWNSDQAGATEHAFIFDAQNGVRDLNNLIDPASGCVLNFARDINDNGQIVGYGELNGQRRGFLVFSKTAAVTLSFSATSPQPEGTLVTLTGQASGGSGLYEYIFWIKKQGGTWQTVQGYSTSNSFVWNTTGYVGTNSIQVWARNVGSRADYEAYSAFSYVVGPASAIPPSAVSVSASLKSPQKEGTVITLTGNAVGGTGPYEYKFWIKKQGGTWEVVRNYSSISSFAWNTTGFPGTNSIQVWARNMGSKADYEAYGAVSYSVVP